MSRKGSASGEDEEWLREFQSARRSLAVNATPPLRAIDLTMEGAPSPSPTNDAALRHQRGQGQSQDSLKGLQSPPRHDVEEEGEEPSNTRRRTASYGGGGTTTAGGGGGGGGSRGDTPGSFTLQLFNETNSNIAKLKTEIESIMDMVLLEVDSTTAPLPAPPPPPPTIQQVPPPSSQGYHIQASSPLTSSSSSSSSSEATNDGIDPLPPPPPQTSSSGRDGVPYKQQTYAYLLAMLKEEKERSRRLEHKVLDLEQQLTERQTEYELRLEEERLELLELKKMLRRMASDSTFADVFSLYEAQIRRLEREVNMLRERNLVLELRKGQPSPQEITWDRLAGELSPGSRSPTPQSLRGSPNQLILKHQYLAQHNARRQLKDALKEVEELRKEVWEYRRRERQHIVQKKMVEGTWSRVQKIQGVTKRMENELTESRLEAARAEARLQLAQEEISDLRRKEDRLKMDRDKALLELGVLQRQIRDSRSSR